MIVNYNFNCPWNLLKKERISQLLSERILILTDTWIFKKICSISFCEKEWIEDKLEGNSYLLSNDRLAVIHIIEVSNKKIYKLVLEKDILLSMLMPGSGQSHFDNLILELKNTIQNN